jgi:integrin beta 3
MVDEVARAVSSSVSRAIAPLQRQLEELVAWRAAVGEIRSGVDGAKGDAGVSGKDGAPGERGVDGRDGRDGADGKDGAPGADGRDGIDGKQGEKGDQGLTGKDGSAGIRGEQGPAGNGIVRIEHDIAKRSLDLVMDNGEIYTLSLPVPPRGEKGDTGGDGKDGRDGIDGKDGSAGVNGRDGSDGIDGKDGSPGIRGDKGDVASQEDIAAAVTKACEALLPAMVAKQYETSMPEIIARASVLVPPGRDGLPGRPGTVGENGRDGASVQQFEITEVGDRKRQFIVVLSDGTTLRKEIEFSGMVLDRDVHRPNEAYEKGDAVTHGGSYWIARKTTKATPGKSDDWRLAVKRGRDGKDAAEEQE